MMRHWIYFLVTFARCLWTQAFLHSSNLPPLSTQSVLCATFTKHTPNLIINSYVTLSPNTLTQFWMNKQDDPEASNESKKNFFSFLSTLIDVFGSISFVVVGGGALLGLALNLSGWGYILPKNVLKDGFQLKIEPIQQLRVENQFARMEAEDARSIMPASGIEGGM